MEHNGNTDHLPPMRGSVRGVITRAQIHKYSVSPARHYTVLDIISEPLTANQTTNWVLVKFSEC